MNKFKFWIAGYFILITTMLTIVGMWTVKIDPFFHFHKPYTTEYFYPLDNQRSQNNGISRNFDYEGLITGTSMTENFKTSEAEAIFGCNFIKVSYSGGSYKEINDNLSVALSNNEKLKIIIRGLDMNKFYADKDQMREDLGTYPTYLYDNNIFNDVQYVFNRDVIFSRVYPMEKENDNPAFQGGILSFDDYSNWMDDYTFGKNTLFPEGITARKPALPIELTQKEINTILENIGQNVTFLADKYPDVDFYYFFTPYSAAWWQSLLIDGTLNKQIEAERIIIEELLKYNNIKLYSFNCLTDITTNLNNYKDFIHYGEWINSLLLNYMREGKGLLTSENYQQYLDDELRFYSTYDYTVLNTQEDYENDYYAAALLNKELNGGVMPLHLDLSDQNLIEMSKAEIRTEQHNGNIGIVCQGSLKRPCESDILVSQYLKDKEYIGFKCDIEDASPYKYLVFYGKKIMDHGQLSVYVYDEEGCVVGECRTSYHDLDEEWHQYLIDISKVNGKATMIFNGGYFDNTGSPESKFVFSDVALY